MRDYSNSNPISLRGGSVCISNVPTVRLYFDMSAQTLRSYYLEYAFLQPQRMFHQKVITFAHSLESTDRRDASALTITKLRSACGRCHQSKMKCSGEMPCTSCSGCGEDCCYSVSNRSGRPKGAKNKRDQEQMGTAQQEDFPSPLSIRPHTAANLTNNFLAKFSNPQCHRGHTLTIIHFHRTLTRSGSLCMPVPMIF